MNRNLQQLMEMSRKIQDQMSNLQDHLASEEVAASAGGGMVKVVADGTGRVKELRIDPAVVDPGDVEMLEDLVLAAISEARKKAHKLHGREIKKLTGGLPIPTGKIPGFF